MNTKPASISERPNHPRHSLITNKNPSTQSYAAFKANQEYFPDEIHRIPKHRLKANAQNKTRDFFANFEQHCRVIYERVEMNIPQLCRNLTPILEINQSLPTASPLREQYQFSFKKTQDPKSAHRNQQQPPVAALPQRYHLSNRPKIKLRKFHSLMAIKQSASTVDEKQAIEGVRRNQSMVKKEGGRIIRLFQLGNTDRNHTENQEQAERSGFLKREAGKREKIKTEAETFEEEKERLWRIRKQLNEIYNNKQGPSQIRLKLY